MKSITDWVKNWLIKYFLADILKGDLNNKKTILGVVGLLITGVCLYLGIDIHSIGWLESIYNTLPVLPETDKPLTETEIAVVISALVAMWGLAGKIIKILLKLWDTFKAEGVSTEEEKEFFEKELLKIGEPNIDPAPSRPVRKTIQQLKKERGR